MDVTPIIIAALAPMSAVVIAVLQICAGRRQKADMVERKKRQEEYDRRDAKREALLMMVLHGGRVTGELAYATAMAYKRGTPNGELDSALKSWNEYDEQFEEYKERLGAESFKKG